MAFLTERRYKKAGRATHANVGAVLGGRALVGLRS